MKKRSTINSFFVEMIIVILFFSVSSVILLKVFVTAGEISEEAKRLNVISTTSQSLCEVYSATGSLDEAVFSVFGEDDAMKCYSEDGYIITADKECAFLSSDDAPMKIYILSEETKTESGVSGKLSIFYHYNGKEIYSISSSAYTPAKEAL